MALCDVVIRDWVMSSVVNIVAEARRNTFYRRVIYTGEFSQLVVMAIPPRDDIGVERHRAVEQTIVIVDGFGILSLGRQRRVVNPGDAIVITPGTRHNLVAGHNLAGGPLKLFTVYTPPNHIDGRVHRTRADAEADIEDREFGELVGY